MNSILAFVLLMFGTMLVVALLIGFVYLVATSLISTEAIKEDKVDYDRKRVLHERRR